VQREKLWCNSIPHVEMEQEWIVVTRN